MIVFRRINKTILEQDDKEGPVDLFQGRVGDIILLTWVEAGQDGWHEERHDAGTRTTDDRPVEKQPGEEAEAGGAPDPDQEQGVHYHLGGKQWDEEGEGEVGVEEEGVDNVAKKSSEHC